MPSVQVQKFSEYRAMAVGMARSALEQVDLSSPPSPDSITMAVPAARLLFEDDASLYPLLSNGFKALAELGRRCGRTPPMLRDPTGQQLAIYHPLVLHLHLAAYRAHYEQLPAAVWSACEQALPAAIEPGRQIEDHLGAGSRSLVLWQCLCVLEQALLLGRDVDIELLDPVVHGVIREEDQRDPGVGNPEAGKDPGMNQWVLDELAGLHALANLALRRRNQQWANRVQEIAKKLLAQQLELCQSNWPWGLFAFAWTPGTEKLDMPQLQRADAETGIITVLLLADAADALGEFG